MVLKNIPVFDPSSLPPSDCSAQPIYNMCIPQAVLTYAGIAKASYPFVLSGWGWSLEGKTPIEVGCLLSEELEGPPTSSLCDEAEALQSFVGHL